MAKVKGLKKQLEDKQAKAAHDLRYGNLKDSFSSTAKEKEKYLKENEGKVWTRAEMEKKIADNKTAADTQSRMNLYKKGGHVKLAKRGRGRAYGKNS